MKRIASLLLLSSIATACGGDKNVVGSTATRPAAGELIVSGTRQPIRWPADAKMPLVDIRMTRAGAPDVVIAPLWASSV